VKLLFVYGNMYSLGGIQTWLARMAASLTANGHEVALLTRPDGLPWDSTHEMLDRVAEHASIHYTGRHWFRPPAPGAASFGCPDVVFACNLEALLLGAQVQERIAPDAKLVAGVFHPREYCWKVPLRYRRFSQHLAERLVRALPIENFVFATDNMVRETGECLGRDFGRSPVLPLTIDTERLRPVPGRPVDRTKVASVTRLAPYYTHHEQMLGVIRELRDGGHDFTYHAYGDGPERERLEAEARRRGVEDAVVFHGSIPYERFSEAVGDAFAYVGLGTALIEAAACGVPSLVAIDSHRGPDTYGFIQDTAGNEIGGFVPGHPEQRIAERLLWLAGLDEEEYGRVGAGSRARAEEFGLDRQVPRFLEFLGEARSGSMSISPVERLLGGIDWLVEAVLLNLGARDAMGARHLRPQA
jgi:glycosyltransferase involved in cell wall biosynthesis